MRFILHTMRKFIYSGGMLFAVLIACLLSAHSEAPDERRPDLNWDKVLPSLPTGDAGFHGDYLADAWQNINQTLMSRSVLYLTGEFPGADRPFTYNSTVGDTLTTVLNAFVGNYPGLVWTQDEKYGTIWIHPASVRYERILSRRLRVDEDQFGLALHAQVLASIAQADTSLGDSTLRGTGWDNTFNPPVDVPKGSYTIRDLLNICCNASPSTTFYMIQDNTSGRPRSLSIQAIHISPSSKDRRNPPPGTALFAKTQLGWTAASGSLPFFAVTNLASPDPSRRQCARRLIQIMYFPFDGYPSPTMNQPDDLWVSLVLKKVDGSE